MMHHDLELRIAELRPGDHVCLLREASAETDMPLVQFVRAGLARGERVLVLREDPASDPSEEAWAGGPELAEEWRRGGLCLVSAEPGALLDLLDAELEVARAAGFQGLRIVHHATARTSLELESSLGEWLSSRDALALCDYARFDLAAEVVHGGLRTHPLVIEGGHLHPNFFAESAELIAADRTAEVVVSGMLRQLELARLAEASRADALRAEIARAAADAAEVARENFLAMLSHELRNAMAPIQYSTELVRRAAPEGPGIGRAVRLLERQVQYMQRLLDGLLDISRINRGKLSLRVTDVELCSLVADAAEHAQRGTSRRHEIDLAVADEPIWVRGDEERVRQIVDGLLGHAQRSTPPHGRIWICALREGSEAVLRVRHEGAGIPPHMVARAFDLFGLLAPGDRTQDRSDGAGIALALARRLTELHGGTVTAHSDGAGKGTELVVRLPADEAHHRSQRARGR